MLWDLRQKVGHATRSVAECLRQAKADMTIRTTLLEARFILGDRELFDELRRELRSRNRARRRARIRRRQTRRTRRARAARRRLALSRRAQCQGRQGRPARPQHAVLDCQICLSRARAARSWSRRGCSPRRNSACSSAARNFLWRVRCHLHFATGRAEERLSFDVQPMLAAQARLSRPRRPFARRTLHETLLSRRQGCGRSDRHRLRGAGGAPGQAARDASTAFSGGCGVARKARAPGRISPSTMIASACATTTSSQRDPVNIIRLFWIGGSLTACRCIPTPCAR